MLERFGKICGWTGNLFAVLTLVGLAYGIYDARARHVGGGWEDWEIYAWWCGFALAFFLIGRALRYIIVGNK
jgi:hypothetical protein